MPVTCRRLPATKSVPEREYLWMGSPFEASGTLEIRQGGKVERYAVEEDTSEPFPGRMWLVNLECGPEEITEWRTGTYRVECGPEGWHCSCSGHKRHGTCKHMLALRDLHERAYLDFGPLPKVNRMSDEEIDRMAAELGWA